MKLRNRNVLIFGGGSDNSETICSHTVIMDGGDNNAAL